MDLCLLFAVLYLTWSSETKSKQLNTQNHDLKGNQWVGLNLVGVAEFMGVARIHESFNLILFYYRIIKLASPNLNYILLFGSSLLYCSMYFYSYSEDAISVDFLTALCNVRTCIYNMYVCMYMYIENIQPMYVCMYVCI